MVPLFKTEAGKENRVFKEENKSLIYNYQNELVRIDAWGPNALRVRGTRNRELTANNWALPEREELDNSKASVEIYMDESGNSKAYMNMREGKDESFASITNGKVKAVINADGVISFYNSEGKLLLKEFWRRLQDEMSTPINIMGRDYSQAKGDNYRIAARFVPNDEEKIFGMGQYQQKQLNMKGCLLELAQRNSQVSVPFYISNIGYGFLWNNPAVGKATFAMNETEWIANSTKQLDYLVIAEDTPAAIEETYMDLVGHAPMMPEYGLGFWQCKLRYRTQEELMTVARKHKELGLPMDVIVADFFHWTQQGEYKFDPKYWPDVEGMCKELEEMGIKLMVSVWPTVDYRSENFKEMHDKGYLIRQEQGVPVAMLCMGNELFFDATNPEARKYVWEKCKQNYYDKGAKLFWLDVAEPEYTTYEFHNYRYYLGSTEEVGNIYPRMYTQGFYDGLTAAGDDKPISLVRSAWAGSAQYGALVWSGDIVSSFECFNRQMRAGLSMAMAGIPWWTTDIGGFHGARTDDPEFHKLFIRWFEYGCFSPVFRLHGNRNPQSNFEEGQCGSGAGNEVWSYSEEVYEICKKYLFLRERLKDYIREQMELTHTKGTPIMRPLFYDFATDKKAWNVDDSYMFGPELLVAPVMEKDCFTREVYLPTAGDGTEWVNVWTKETCQGGTFVTVDVPIDQIPVFAIKGSKLAEMF